MAEIDATTSTTLIPSNVENAASIADQTGELRAKPVAGGMRTGTGTPAVTLILLLGVSSLWDGSFHLQHWAPVAIFTILAVVGAFVGGRYLRIPRPLQVAALALWAFMAWDAFTAAWADSAALAFEGAGRTALYAGIASAVALIGPESATQLRAARLLVGVWTVVVGVTAVRLATDGVDAFTAGRLDAPVGYPNASAALFAMAALALVAIAARRDRSPLLRGGAFAAAVLSGCLVLLTQSRGGLIAVAAGAIVLIAATPDRGRAAFLLLLLAAVIAPAAPLLDDPWQASGFGQSAASPASIATAWHAVAIATAAALGVGLAVSLFDHGLRASETTLARLKTTLVAFGIAVVAAGAVYASVNAGDLTHQVRTKLDEFRGSRAAEPGAARLTYVGGPRYDLWRIAADDFTQRPWGGVGESNYGRSYFAERRTDRNLSDPHSLPLRLLAETGLVGFGLFLLFLAAMAFTLRGIPRLNRAERSAAAPLLAAATVGLVQSAVDWTWLVPAVFGFSILAFALAALLASKAAPPAPIPRAARVGVGAVAVAAAVLVGALFLSDAELRQARAAGTPEARLTAAQHASSLNPWSLDARYLEASAYEDLRSPRQAREALQRALDLEPRNFVTWALVGDFELRRHDFHAARLAYGTAARLNPRDVGIAELRDQAVSLARRSARQ